MAEVPPAPELPKPLTNEELTQMMGELIQKNNHLSNEVEQLKGVIKTMAQMLVTQHDVEKAKLFVDKLFMEGVKPP